MEAVEDDGWQLVSHKKRRRPLAQQANAAQAEQCVITTSTSFPKLKTFRSEPRLDTAGLDAYDRTIINAVQAELDQLNLSTFENWYDKFEIYQLSTPSTNVRHLSKDMRLLEIGRHGRAVILPVRYVSCGIGSGKKILVVLTEAGSVPLAEWLSPTSIDCIQRMLTSKQVDILGQDGYDVQYQWWCAHGLFGTSSACHSSSRIVFYSMPLDRKLLSKAQPGIRVDSSLEHQIRDILGLPTTGLGTSAEILWTPHPTAQ